MYIGSRTSRQESSSPLLNFCPCNSGKMVQPSAVFEDEEFSKLWRYFVLIVRGFQSSAAAMLFCSTILFISSTLSRCSIKEYVSAMASLISFASYARVFPIPERHFQFVRCVSQIDRLLSSHRMLSCGVTPLGLFHQSADPHVVPMRA